MRWRVGWTLVFLLLWPAAASALTAFSFEPLANLGANKTWNRTYSSRSTILEDRVVRWQVAYVNDLGLPNGGRQVTLRTTSLGAALWPPARTERLVVEPRGVFLNNTQDMGGDPLDYGPGRLLPAPAELARLDTVWRFAGRRTVPFAFTVIQLGMRGTQPVPLEARYHVLNIGPLDTPAGSFRQAIQVSGFERVQISLLTDEPQDVLVRVRRWYVPGVGLAKEILAFPGFPSLGQLITVLDSYVGFAPDPSPLPLPLPVPGASEAAAPAPVAPAA